jgi:chromosome partitioning protein
MNLGYALAQRGHNVLLVDMDLQSSLTVFIGLQPCELEGTISESVLERSPLPILREIHQMELVPRLC